MITNFTKTSLGVLKPHFLTVRNGIRAKKVFLRHILVIFFSKNKVPHLASKQECRPNNATRDALIADGRTWVDQTLTRTICDNQETDYRRSFPSGHASQVGDFGFNF